VSLSAQKPCPMPSAMYTATLAYLCSETYVPRSEHAVQPLDPELAIAWPMGRPVLSERDATAPSLSQARAGGLLPDYQQCLQWADSL
jgi:dTDP-4-dehydrorhamnose 3,5-epimerase